MINENHHVFKNFKLLMIKGKEFKIYLKKVQFFTTHPHSSANKRKLATLFLVCWVEKKVRSVSGL